MAIRTASKLRPSLQQDHPESALRPRAQFLSRGHHLHRVEKNERLHAVRCHQIWRAQLVLKRPDRFPHSQPLAQELRLDKAQDSRLENASTVAPSSCA